MHLFHITSKEIEGDRIILKSQDVLHIRKVLRKKIGDRLYFTDSRKIYQAKISQINDHTLTCQILEQDDYDGTPPLDLYLYTALVQFSCFESILNFSTQLGVKTIIPVRTEYTQNLLVREERFRRWQKIIREAAKQSFNPRPPELVMEVLPFSQVIGTNSPSLLLHPWAREGLKQTLGKRKETRLDLFLGPEAGFSEKEIDLAKEKNTLIARLPFLVLRAETAVAAAVSCILFHYEEHELKDHRC